MLNPGGVTILRLSPDMVVKYGPHATITEAQSMIFVAEHTKLIPVPKVFAYCTHGPLNRDIDDYGSLFDTYIFMSFVDGQTLESAWDSYDELTKTHVANQLRTYMDEVRAIRSEPYIGSVNKGPVRDQILANYHVKGSPPLPLTLGETNSDVLPQDPLNQRKHSTKQSAMLIRQPSQSDTSEGFWRACSPRKRTLFVLRMAISAHKTSWCEAELSPVLSIGNSVAGIQNTGSLQKRSSCGGGRTTGSIT